MKVGLALSGGGALGAFQVGMLRALSELGGKVDMLAGASVGSLNAAVVASAPSLDTAVQRLEHLWRQENPFWDLILSALWLRLSHLKSAPKIVSTVRAATSRLGLSLSFFTLLEDGLLSPKPISDLIDKYLDSEALANGLPLYVSVYSSHGAIDDLIRTLLAEVGIVDTPKSTYVHLQELPTEEQKECLLASAALPVFFKSRMVEGSLRSDGGLGGRQTDQGNVPVEPLIDAGCDMILIMHAGRGYRWSRDGHPGATFVEILPPRTKSLRGLFEWDDHVISSWIDEGYKAAKSQIGRVNEALESFDELRQSKARVAVAEDERVASEGRMERALDGWRRRAEPDSQ